MEHHGRAATRLGSDQRADADPLRALSSSYTLRELRTEGTQRVFVAEPHGSLPDRCAWRYTFWITPEAEPFLARYRADVPNPSSEACDGVWQEVSYALVDGIPKPSHVHAHFFQFEASDRITIDGDDTYTDYRRFTTHVTIGPA